MKILAFVYHITRNIFENFYALMLSLFQKKMILSEVYFNNCSELFIKHTFGGGTKTYERNYCNKKSIYIMRNVRGFNTKYVTLEKVNEKKKYFVNIKNIPILFKLLGKIKITVSSIVPYTNYVQIFDELLKYKNRTNAYISYLVHDFHCVCPNYTLVVQDSYCNLNCEKCRCKICKNIKEWRFIWGVFFSEIDEIRVFSQSSQNLVLKAFPQLNITLFNLVPHDMTYCNFKPYKIRADEAQRIAIVGTCDTVPKGNIIVNEFLSIYSDREIVLFGKTPLTSNARKNKSVINFGHYNNPDLPRLMEKYNVNTVVFPSIWEETFSYIISEQIKLGIIIVCFDLGAQGEKVRKYNKGIVIKEMTAQALVEVIRKL